jgi:hypothetical protein
MESMEVYGADYFQNGLNRQVEEEDGEAIVTAIQRDRIIDAGPRKQCVKLSSILLSLVVT